MARQIVNTTYRTPDGWSYRLEIWDLYKNPGGVIAFTDVEITTPGFTIDWKGSIDDILQPIMSSSMKFSAYLTEYQRTHLTLGVYSDEEFAMAVRLYRSTGNQETLEWAGIIHPEETTEEIGDGRILTTFLASDGIATLKNIDFKDTSGSEPVLYYNQGSESSERALIYWLKEIVNKLPHWAVLDAHIVTSEPLFVEHRLVRPVNATHQTFPSDDAVLDHYFLKADSFYTNPKPSEERKKGFDRKRTDRRTNFVSTYDILADICSSLGATFCFSDGKFHLFDRERIIRGDDDDIGFFKWTKDSNGLFSHSVVFNSSGSDIASDLQRVDLDYAGADFLKGATRRGVYPVESVAQVHEGAGSDLLFRSGIGYDGPTFETFLYRKEDINVNTQLDAILTSNYYSNLPPNGIVDELSIPNGSNDGTFRLHFSGDASYWNSGSGIGGGSYENDNRGNIAVLRLDIKVYDGSNWFRLRRRVRTLAYTSTGAVFDIDVPSTSQDYRAKTYEQYQWIKDTASNYSTAFLEVMIGADPTVLTDDNAGSTDEFLQSQEFSYVFYTPPLLKQGDGDLELVADESRSHFIYRFDEEIQMPTTGEGVSSSISKIQISPVLRLYEVSHYNHWNGLLDSNGDPVDVVSSSQEDVNFSSSSWPLVTASQAGGSVTGSNYSESDSILRSFQLSGIEVYTGDGTENYDARYVSSISAPSNGSEQVSLDSTTFGATFENSGNRTFGRYRASHPSDTSSPLNREDNLKFHPDGSSMSYADMYVAMGYYATSRALSIRNKTRQSVSGTIIRRNPDTVGYDVCRPYKKFSTKKLSGNVEYFLPHSLTLQVKDHAQRVEALRCLVEAEITTVDEASDTGRDPNGPPGSGNGGFTPGGGVNHIFQKNNALETTVAGHTSKLQFITVTEEVDLNNITAGGDTSSSDLFQIFLEK